MTNIKISVISPSIRPEGLKVVQECLKNQTMQSFEWLTEVGIPERGHDLNAAFNRMIKRAKGELLVFYQDYIKIQDNGLDLFWEAYQKEKKTFFTAPVGKTIDWQDVKWDWRAHPEAQMSWTQWEIDWGACPKDAMFDIGGFDEELDRFWSFDNVNAGCRADLKGYKFANLPENKAVAWDHDKMIEHPFRPKFNPTFHNQRMDQFRRGLCINYLV